MLDSVAFPTEQWLLYLYYGDLKLLSFVILSFIRRMSRLTVFMAAAFVPCALAWASVPDLDVDTNRDGRIENSPADDANEDVWTLAQGAIFLNNNDNDGRGTAPDNVDHVIDGGEDTHDITPIRIRDPVSSLGAGTRGSHQLVLRIATDDLRKHVRIFPGLAAGQRAILGPGRNADSHEPKVPIMGEERGAWTRLDITDLVLGKSDQTFGLEGLTYRTDPSAWDGMVDIELILRQKEKHAFRDVGIDRVTLKVAPFIAASNVHESIDLFVTAMPNVAWLPRLRYVHPDSWRSDDRKNGQLNRALIIRSWSKGLGNELLRFRAQPVPAIRMRAGEPVDVLTTGDYTLREGSRQIDLRIRPQELPRSNFTAAFSSSIPGIKLVRQGDVRAGSSLIYRHNDQTLQLAGGPRVSIRQGGLADLVSQDQSMRLVVSVDVLALPQRSTSAVVEPFTDNLVFRQKLARAAEPMVRLRVIDQPYGLELWAQDKMEFGWSAFPGRSPGRSPGRNPGRNTLPVVLDLPKTTDSLRDYPYDVLLGEVNSATPLHGAAHGYARPMNFEPGSNNFESSLCYGGNVEVVPPVPRAPQGRIIMGSHGLDMTARPNRALNRLRHFFDAQELQGPVLLLDVSWLHVGHIDEVMQFVPCEEGAGLEHKFKIFIASPADALRLLHELPGPLRIKSINQGRKTTGGPGQTKRRWEYTPHEIMDDVDRLTTINRQVQAMIDKRVKEPLIERLGLRTSDFIDLPVLFAGQFRTETATLWPRSAYALTPNLANCLVLTQGTDHRILMAQPGYDPFRSQVVQVAQKNGLNIEFIDTWFYHTHAGDIHCVTNVRRGIPPRAWWQASPGPMGRGDPK